MLFVPLIVCRQLCLNGILQTSYASLFASFPPFSHMKRGVLPCDSFLRFSRILPINFFCRSNLGPFFDQFQYSRVVFLLPVWGKKRLAPFGRSGSRCSQIINRQRFSDHSSRATDRVRQPVPRVLGCVKKHRSVEKAIHLRARLPHFVAAARPQAQLAAPFRFPP